MSTIGPVCPESGSSNVCAFISTPLGNDALGNDGYQLPSLWPEILRRGRPSRAGKSLCAFDRIETAPIIRGAFCPRRLVREPKQVGATELCIASSAWLCDLNKP